MYIVNDVFLNLKKKSYFVSGHGFRHGRVNYGGKPEMEAMLLKCQQSSQNIDDSTEGIILSPYQQVCPLTHKCASLTRRKDIKNV